MDSGGRRHQHELSMVADQAHQPQSPGTAVSRRPVPVREPDAHRPDLRHNRRPVQEMQRDQHLPAGDGVLFGQRILGEGRLADEHRSDREGRSARSSAGAGVLCCRASSTAAPAIRRRRVFASSSSIRSTPRRCSGRFGKTSTSGRRAASHRRRRRFRSSATGHSVPPLPQAEVGFPKIPGVTYTGLKTTRYRFNYGPNFYRDRHTRRSTRRSSRRPTRTIRRTARSIRATCRRPTATATISPGFGCRN